MTAITTLETEIQLCTTMAELDSLRLRMLQASKVQIQQNPDCLNGRGQTPLQALFIKQKNRIQRGDVH